MQAEEARRELEITVCHGLCKEAGEAGTHKLELSEENTKGHSFRSWQEANSNSDTVLPFDSSWTGSAYIHKASQV